MTPRPLTCDRPALRRAAATVLAWAVLVVLLLATAAHARAGVEEPTEAERKVWKAVFETVPSETAGDHYAAVIDLVNASAGTEPAPRILFLAAGEVSVVDGEPMDMAYRHLRAILAVAGSTVTTLGWPGNVRTEYKSAVPALRGKKLDIYVGDHALPEPPSQKSLKLGAVDVTLHFLRVDNTRDLAAQLKDGRFDLVVMHKGMCACPLVLAFEGCAAVVKSPLKSKEFLTDVAKLLRNERAAAFLHGAEGCTSGGFWRKVGNTVVRELPDRKVKFIGSQAGTLHWMMLTKDGKLDDGAAMYAIDPGRTGTVPPEQVKAQKAKILEMVTTQRSEYGDETIDGLILRQ